jgi:hypothetical protein
VDNPPTLDPIANVTIDEDAGPQTVVLTGISDGDVGTQTLSLSATITGGNAGIIKDLAVQRIGTTSQGLLTFGTVQNAFGTVTVQVTVSDGNSSLSRSFNIVITPVNDPPVILGQANTDLITITGQPITLNKTDLDYEDVDSPDEDISLIVLAGSNYTRVGNVVTPTPGFTGLLSVNVRLTDGQPVNGLSEIFQLKVIVTGVPNVPPSFGAGTPSESVLQGELYSFTPTVIDPDDALEDLFFFVENKPSWLNFDSATGALTGTPGNSDVGVYNNIRIRVTDGKSAPVALGPFSITVINVNDPPTISGNPPLEATPGQLYQFIPQAQDEDAGDVLTFSIQNLPPWAQFNIQTGELRGTPTRNDAGVYPGIVIAVTDGIAASVALPAFTITVIQVNLPPQITGVPASFVFEGEAYVFNPVISDPDGDPVTLGVENLPSWLNFNAATGALTGTPGDADAGIYSGIAITATDGKSDTVRLGPFSITVIPVNSPPTLNDIVIPGAITVNAGEQQVELSGITVGPNDETQSIISITATSSSQSIIPNANIRIEPEVSAANPLVGTTARVFYTANNNSSGTVVITVTVRDNGSNNNTISKSFPVIILAVNSPPQINIPATVTVEEDQVTPPIPLTGINDGDGGTQGIAEIIATTTTPNLITNLSVTGFNEAAGTAVFNYELVRDAFGTAVVNIRVRDNGGVIGGGNDVKDIQFNIVILPVNDPPVITGQATQLSTFENQSISINVTALIIADVDNVPGDFTLEILPPAAGADYTVNGNIVTPKQFFNGLLEVPVLVRDLEGAASNVFNLVITVIPVNNPPKILGQDPDPLTTLEDTPIALELTQLIVEDPDSPFPTGFSFHQIGQGANYTVNANVITPNLNFNGTLFVPVIISDNAPENSLSNTFIVQIEVLPVNDPPVITGQFPVSVLEDNPLVITLGSLIVVDPDNDYPDDFTLEVQSGPNYTLSGDTITPILNFFGTLLVPVRVNDGEFFSNVFNLSVNVIPVNDPPTISPIPDQPIIRDGRGVTRLVNLGGISPGPETGMMDPNQLVVSITATSSNRTLVRDEDIVISYVPGQAFGTLTYSTVPFVDGETTITITVRDNGGTANGGIDTRTTSFRVFVEALNRPPTIDAISDLAILESSPPVTVRLRNIRDGDNGTQNLTVIARSSNTALIPNPVVEYTPNKTEGNLVITPVPGRNGVSTITVVVRDDGGLENGGLDSVRVSFDVLVAFVNDPPTINPIQNISILEDSDTVIVNMTGITDGDPDREQTILITAISSDPGVIPNPSVVYTSPNTTGQLKFRPRPNRNGPVIITVTLRDDGGAPITGREDTRTISFVVDVIPVNDPPTINPVADRRILEGAGRQTILLTGITDGDPEANQNIIKIEPSTQRPELYSELFINYVQGNFTAELIFTTAPKANGVDVITITLQDDGGTENGGIDTRTINFTLTVDPVNDPPNVDPVPDPAEIPKNSGRQCITLTGINDGDPELDQLIFISAVNNNPDLLILEPVAYIQGSTRATLCYTPVPNARGMDTITVTLQDDGGFPGVDTRVISFVVRVGITNNPPVVRNAQGQAINSVNFSTAKDDRLTICFTATDIDQDEIVFGELGTNPTLGRVISFDNETLCLEYEVRPASLSGEDFFEVNICDVVEPATDIECTTVRVFIDVLPAEVVQAYGGISPGTIDQRNDEWIIEGIENYPNNRVKVFGKTGVLVFEMQGYDNRVNVWRGTSNAGLGLGQNNLPSGAYYYIIDLGEPGKKPITGSIMVR